MTEKHIKGPLTVGETVTDTIDGIQEIVINAVRGGMECYPFVAIEFGSIPGMQQENARRLVACWNACDGVSTEWLENTKTIVLLGEPASERFKALELENRALAAALKVISDGNVMAGKAAWTTTDVMLRYQEIASAAIGHHKTEKPS